MADTDAGFSLGDYMALLRRRWVYLVTIIPGAILVAVFLAFTLPPSYRSSATILLEASSIKPELVQTTVTSYADERIELVQRKVMTQDVLAEVVAEVDPYPDMPEMSVKEKASEIIDNTEIERVDPVTLKPLAESNAFSIHYANPNPELAKSIARKLANLFLTFNQRTRSDQARQTYGFLLQQAESVAKRIRDLEQQLADFKSKHGDALPEAQDRNQQSLDRAERDLDSLESQLRIAEEKKSLLEVQIGQVSPNLIASVGGSPTDLPTLRAELVAAEQRYTPDHPDVKRLRRALEALQKDMAASGSRAVVKADNPEYLALASQLDGAKREAAALQANAARTRQQISNYNLRLTGTPEIERRYVQLDREHQGARAQYDDLQNKLREAQLAQNLESEQFGERYTLIRQPQIPDMPFSPNRLGLILIGVVLGGGIAVGLVAVAESSDPSVRSARDLQDLTSLPTLGAVPFVLNASDRRRRLTAWSGGSIAFLVATAVVVVTVVQSG